VREEIERLEAQLRDLESRVAYSTITVTITPPPTKPEPKPPEPDFLPVFYSALTGLYTVVSGIIYISVAGWPVAAILYGGYRAYRRFIRREMAKSF